MKTKTFRRPHLWEVQMTYTVTRPTGISHAGSKEIHVLTKNQSLAEVESKALAAFELFEHHPTDKLSHPVIISAIYRNCPF